MGILDTLSSWLGIGTTAVAPRAEGARMRPQRQPTTRSEGALLAMYRANPELRTPVQTVARTFSGCSIYGADRDGEPLPDNHPLARMLARPCEDYSGRGLLELTSIYLDTTGDVFGVLEADDDDDGELRLYLMPPTWVEPVLGEMTTYEVRYPSGRRVTYSDEQMIWLKDIDPLNPYGRGCGAGWAAADEVDIAEASSGYTTGFFRNGARPESLVFLPGASVIQAREAEEQYRQHHQGISYGLEFIGGPATARMEIERLSTDFQDLGVLELRQRVADIIRRLYGVPPELIGQLEHSNRATIEAAFFIIAKTVLEPRCRWWCEEMTHALIPRAQILLPARAARAFDGVRLSYTSPIPEDREARREVMRATPWAFTVNEHRAQAGAPARPDGNVYLRDTQRLQSVEAGEPEDMTMQARFVGYAVTKRQPPVLPDNAVVLFPETPLLRIVDDTAPRTKQLTRDEIDEVLRALEPERINAGMRAPLQQTLHEWAARAGAEPGVNADITELILNPFVADYLDEFAERQVKTIHATTRTAIAQTLTDGVREGEGVDELTQRVMTASAFGRSRAELIARTEVLRAANAAKHRAYELSPVVRQIQWVATMDRRTRPNHAALNGQVRTLGTPFSLSGDIARHPGAFGSASMDCRCRCTIVAYFEDQRRGVSELAAAWKNFDKELEGDDARAIEAVADALVSQRDDIIRAIERFAMRGAA